MTCIDLYKKKYYKENEELIVVKFRSIRKVHEGEFITRYDVIYETADNKEKVYEMISRNRNITDYESLSENKEDAVVLIMHDESGEKILLNREFRMAVGKPIYNFPAGLIDKGEDVYQSARRELKEETGLNLVRIEHVLFDSYSAVGFSNEKNKCIIGVAEGEFAESSSTYEEIEAAWYTREQVRELLKDKYFAARTQTYCYMWAKEE